MKISKFLLILTFFVFSVTSILAQVVEQEVTADQSLNGAIDFVHQGGANVLVLATDGGVYETNPFDVDVPFTIKAKEGLSVKPTILIKGAGGERFINLRHHLTLDGLKIDGLDATTSVYDSVRYVVQVRFIDGADAVKQDLVIRNCDITNVYRYGDPEFSTDGTILDFERTARAGTVLLENNTFSNTGDEALRSINTHKDPEPADGRYCNSFTVKNCTFSNIRGTGIKIEGDSDSTNTDPQIVMENLTFDGCQRRVIWHRQMFGSIIRNILITNSIRGNDNFSGSQALITYQGFGTTVAHVDTFNIQGVKANGDTVTLEYGSFVAEAGSHDGSQRLPELVDETTIFNHDPQYADAANGNYTLADGSPILTLGHDGGAIGDRNWATGGTVTDVNDVLELPKDYSLHQNYPNPFNPSTKIEFSIPASGKFTLKIYNILGQEVTTLLNSELNAGRHVVNFNAAHLSSGVYIYSLVGNNVNLNKKMILLK